MSSHSSSVEERKAALLDALASRRVAVARALVEAMRTEIGEYAALMGPGGSASPEFAREVAAHALEHVDAFVRAARSGSAPTGGELDFIRERAEMRARQLLPLDALMQAYLLGQRVFWETLRELAGDEPDDLRALAGLTTSTFRYTQAISVALAETYSLVVQRATADRDRARRDLLDTLLAQSGPVPESVARRAEQLGLDPDEDRVVAVLVPASGETPLRAVAETVVLQAPGAAFAVPRHDEVVALLPGPSGEAVELLSRAVANLARAHPAEIRAGVGTACASLDDVGRGYREAARALRHSSARRPVVALEEVGLFDQLTATADPSARRLVPEAVARLARDASLAETLHAYARCDLNVTETARHLVVHANTVHYRLGRVREITGRDPRRFGDLLELLAALRLLGADPQGLAST